jgi:antirestriction protein
MTKDEFTHEVEQLELYDQSKALFLFETIGLSYQEALDNYEDVTFYKGMNLKQVAEDMVDVGLFGEVPKSLAAYIDYEQIAIDLDHDGCYWETDEGVFEYHW